MRKEQGNRTGKKPRTAAINAKDNRYRSKGTKKARKAKARTHVPSTARESRPADGLARGEPGQVRSLSLFHCLRIHEIQAEKPQFQGETQKGCTYTD